MTTGLKLITGEHGPELNTNSEWAKLYTINLFNTDDALTQGKWSAFQQDVKRIVVSEETALVHGLWYTSPALDYQSMSLSFNLTGEFPEMAARTLKGCLKGLSEEYEGCTIQWTEAVVSYF